MGEQKPRPVNCYVLYRKDKSAEIRQRNPGVAFQNHTLSQMTGMMWRQEPKEVKEFYLAKARELASLKVQVKKEEMAQVMQDQKVQDDHWQESNPSIVLDDGVVWAHVRTPSPNEEFLTLFKFD